ncbi:unnamed protein product [Diatraea saccharalis]|uniref:tRNA (guanosine(18)-2'-O)-methyltransferase TARBP1 n=1 Tax=Diatraea saccharalis TaxID=40085 RepID=A0A9P0C5W3_9NEOP|nr:unnamed protein product [Diatraea saccharalis]
MISDENVLSFLDLLDLDEELIDSRLKSIMSRREISDKHLVSAIHLLQYKQLVNLQENSECDNEEEYEFCTKLVREVNVSNIENVCKIITIALGLNSSTLVNKCEHFIQQILSELPPKDEPDDTRAILILKVTDSILHAVSNCSTKLFLPLLEIPVKNILCSSNENMKIQFLSSTVPKMFAAVTGFNILDSIWDFVKHLHDDNRSIALKVLSSLSDYYLPTPDNSGVVLFESKIVLQAEFWQTILYGLLSTDLLLRKLSIYLAKRALDCVLAMKKDVLVEHNGNIIFQWIHAESNSLKTMWDNYFILIDSLEEKQSNIVLPSLNLFPSLKAMGHWLNCAFNIGLKHDNIQVRLKCINHRLEIKLNSKTEAIVLLEALNYINIYDNTHEVEALKKKFSMFVKDKDILLYIIASIPMLQWSPVPLYHLSCILSDEDLKNKITLAGEHIVPIILDILKIPCNNVPLRKAIHINIAYFVGNCCSGLHWREYANIYLCLQMDLSNTSIDKNPFLNLIKKMINEDGIFFDFIQQSYLNIDFGLFYLQQHKEELPIYIDILHEKIKKIDNITNRHYSDKRECLDDVIYLNQLICKTDNKNHDNVINIRETINTIISSNFKTILLYISSLLVNNTILTIEEIALISDGLHSIFNARNIEQIKEAMLQLYKMSVLFTKDKNVALESVILSLHIIHGLTNNSVLLSIPEQERLNVQDVLKIAANFESKQSIGRLRNMFYEKSCEIVFEMLNQKYCCTDTHTDSILEYIQVVLDCGGYGCLQLCLKIINKMLPFVLMRTDTKFNMEQFICRMWKEIEELKSNNQYTPCIREFINLITHEHLLRLPTFNNIVLLYCKKIVDYGPVKVTPLFYLISKLNSTVLTVDHGHVIYILCDILMFSPVPRKDQRIIENLLVKILKEAKYGFDQTYLGTHFNFEVNYCSVLILSKIKDTEILCTIEKFIKNKIDESFKNKQRYHGHSQGHRLLLTGLQHLLLISLMKVNNSGTRTDPTEDMNWCIELLKKLPHQISVRICLEWYIALHLVKMKISLNEELLESFNDIPLISQLFVLYWTAKRIILSEKDDASGQFEFVMDFLLCHTMGPMFNTRLHAQYLATKLNEVSHIIIPKYPFIMTLIERTFKEGENDKNYVKIKDDYFINNFDIIQDLTPSFIYYFLPKYCEINNEFIDIDYVRSTFNAVNSNISDNMLSTDFHKEWVDFHRTDDEIFSLNICNEEGGKLYEGIEASGTIQKKYVPWKNMSDVYVYEAERKKENKSELIVVASLIDKLPNLGGMARTSEVFGVKTYVVDSLRHLQDKQFQSLSVSAERWINVEEVRPGQALKQYLIAKKSEGYCVVAAEQTSTSVKLQNFQFPMKTLLLLGHEKEGIPCDLLPIMDYCVEIPQQGFVRSLNVHVTAAIFIWEYTRQNIL